MDTIKKECCFCGCSFDGIYDGCKICDDCQEKIDIFDNYKFGVNTEIGIYANEVYYKVLDIDFEKREIRTQIGTVGIESIREIRN